MENIINKKDLKKAIALKKAKEDPKRVALKKLGFVAGQIGIGLARLGIELGPVAAMCCLGIKGNQPGTVATGVLSTASAVGMAFSGVEDILGIRQLITKKGWSLMLEDKEFLSMSIAGSIERYKNKSGNWKYEKKHRKEAREERRKLKIKALTQAGIIKEEWDYAKKFKTSKKYKVNFIKTKSPNEYAPYFVIKTPEGLKYIKIEKSKVSSPITIDKSNIESIVKTNELYSIDELSKEINNYYENKKFAKQLKKDLRKEKKEIKETKRYWRKALK